MVRLRCVYSLKCAIKGMMICRATRLAWCGRCKEDDPFLPYASTFVEVCINSGLESSCFLDRPGSEQGALVQSAWCIAQLLRGQDSLQQRYIGMSQPELSQVRVSTSWAASRKYNPMESHDKRSEPYTEIYTCNCQSIFSVVSSLE